MGRAEGLEPSDIIHAITAATGLDGESVRNVRLLERFSFVEVPERDAQRVVELSGGQQQRVLIAKALASEPELLILDEPIAGVDAQAQRLFRDSLVHLLRDHGAAVLLVSHELGAVAEDLDRVVVLRRRVLFDGKPGDLAATGVSLGVHRDDLPRWLEELTENGGT